MRRRHLLAATLALPAPALAQGAEWSPNRPLRLVIPFTPAGTTDLVGRLGAEALSRRLGQQVVVENRAGAGGNVGADFVAKAEPDGHTLLLTTIGTGAINFAVYGDKMPYRPEDLRAVGLFIRVPNVLMATNALPVRDLRELTALAKARNGGLNYGTAGIGSSPHICTELYKIMAGVEMTHIPYRGSAPMLTELIAGRVDVGVDNIPSSLAFCRDRLLRPLATTGARRSPVLPEVPTMQEQGLAGYEATAWFGVLAPARTPDAAVARLGREIDGIVKEPAFSGKVAEFGGELPALTPDGGTSPASFETFLAAERQKWAEVARRSGARVE
jgi:tripartite-type tricarboxylate transporter receptor subunit TctC